MRCISKDCYFMGINKICYCFIDFLYRYITCRILFCNGFRRFCNNDEYLVFKWFITNQII